MKSVTFTHFIWSLLAILAFGSFGELQGMDEIEGMKEWLVQGVERQGLREEVHEPLYEKILKQAIFPVADKNKDLYRATSKGHIVFIPTGKLQYATGWRVGGPSGQQPYQNDFEAALRNGTLNTLVQKYGASLITDPWINVSNRTAIYVYPIEHVLSQITAYPISAFTALLTFTPINGFPDYSPLKTILSKLTGRWKTPQEMTRLTQCLQILVDHKVDLDLPLPEHNGLGKEYEPICINCTAQEFLEQTKDKWDQANWAEVKAIFDKGPRTSASTSSTTTPTISSATTTGISIENVEPQGKLSWHEKVSSWCKKPTSAFTKKSICIAVVGIAATLAIAKIAYKKWFKKQATSDNTTPIQVTVINNTKTAINLVTYNADDTVTVSKLANLASWNGTVYQFAQIVILKGSAQTTRQAPAAIHLDRYMKLKTSDATALTITINTASALQRWWTGNPYTYTATWQ